MKKLRIEETDLIGLCYGGTIALEFAKNYPELTKKVVVIEASLDPQNMVREQQLLYTLRSKPVLGGPVHGCGALRCVGWTFN